MKEEITVQELSVGNFVKVGKDFYEVIGISGDVVMVYDKDKSETAFGISSLEPIKLTHRHFKKEFGFTKELRGDEEDKDVVYNNGYDIHWDKWNRNFAYATYVRGDGTFKGGTVIPSLHRLQNLHQALNGQPLNIQP